MTSRRYLLALTFTTAALAVGCTDYPRRPTEASPGQCGGFQGLPCAAGETCELPAGECQVSDNIGMCVQTPDFCTQEFDPVCGCDGVTYSNDCTRLMAGVQKSADGACLSSSQGSSLQGF